MRQRPPARRARSPPSIGHSTASAVTRGGPKRRSSIGPRVTALLRTFTRPKVTAGSVSTYAWRSSSPVRGEGISTSAVVDTAASFQVTTRISSLHGSAGVRRECDREGGARARLRLLRRLPARGRRAGGGASLGADRGEVEGGRGAVQRRDADPRVSAAQRPAVVAVAPPGRDRLGVRVRTG